MGFLREAEGNIPMGGIILWSGAISAVPTGFVICDGNNSTPNLTDRFVIHADNDSGGTNDVGDTGGEQTHTLNANEIPAHNHSPLLTHRTGDAGAQIRADLEFKNNSTGQTGGDMTWEGTDKYKGTSVGGGAAHENRPKYYALAYIIKT